MQQTSFRLMSKREKKIIFPGNLPTNTYVFLCVALLISTRNIYFCKEIIRLTIYSPLSLSRPRLFRITAYLEVKIWSLFKHENLTTGNKILCKRGEIAPNFSSFPQYFKYISDFRSQITYSFVKCGCSIYFSSILQMSRYEYLEAFQGVPWTSR